MFPVQEEVLRAWTGGGGWNDSPPEPVPPRENDDKKDDPPNEKPSALVAGRFLPPHAGHRYLIDVARARASKVTIVIVEESDDFLSGALREIWLRQMFGGVGGVDVIRVAARDARESPRAWLKLVPNRIDLVFTSDEHNGMDEAIAKAFGARLVLVDPKHEAIAVSGEDVRRDVMARFDALLPPARSHFVRRVAIVGPESTGKTTLARSLAETYRTVAVPERARFVATRQAGVLGYDDIAEIAAGQISSVTALEAQANRLLFCDTNLRSIDLWSQRLFDRSPSWLSERAKTDDAYDLVLIMAPDVPFVGASHHDQPGPRRAFFESIIRAEMSSNVAIIQGTWEERERLARNAVDALLTSPELLPARHRLRGTSPSSRRATNRNRADRPSAVE